ncbi:hypothetical protein HQ585_18700 [candidate division KSB1 bacterium]|nr:hypothetical protein [candidate division KSB1 bacterium]
MKRFLGILLAVLIISIASMGFSQIPDKGFFLGGSATAMMVNGKGEVEDEDFSLSDDLFSWEVESSNTSLSVTWQPTGMGWGNKLLYGIKPVVGYRVSPQMAILGTYSMYMNKKADQSESASGQGTVSDVTLSADAESEYTQRAMQILLQYHLTPGKEFFLIGGMEFVSMKAELKHIMSMESDWYDSVGTLLDVDGEDKTNGLVIGAGIEKPLQSKKNMSFVASAMYSFTKYEGDELFEGEGDDPEIKLNIGGFIANIGIRMYFNNEASVQ